MPATQGQAAAILATAGKKAAGLAQRIAAAASDVAMPDGPSQFAARISAKQRLTTRLRPLQNKVSEMFDSAARTADKISFPQNRRPLQPILSQSNAPASMTRLAAISERMTRTPLGRSSQTPARLAAPSQSPREYRQLREFNFPLPDAAVDSSRPTPAMQADHQPQQPSGASMAAISRQAHPAMEDSRKQLPTDETNQIDYRTLGPTQLRDMLTQRGGTGAAVEFAVRERLAGPLKFDPGLARLHRGTAAADAARTLRAEAFTIGRDVFFGEGRYDPASKVGLGLLAHELTHVGQQARRAAASMRFFTASGGDAEEREAQETAGVVMGENLRQPGSESGSNANSPVAQPKMEYAMPPSRQNVASGDQSQSAAHYGTQSAASGSGEASHDSPNSRAVSDRVYQLMMQELIRDRERGLAYKRG